MAKYNPSFGRLTDEELLRQVRASTVDPLVEELCQRLEKKLDQSAKMGKQDTTPYSCPECNTRLSVWVDSVDKKISLTKAPLL